MRLFERAGGVPADVLARAELPRGEKLLAHAPASDGSWLLGTRQRLTLVQPAGTTQVAWERVEEAAWDQEGSRLTVTEIGAYGEPRPAYSFQLEDPSRLLQLVRERVTASIVLQRRIPVRGKLGLTIIGRRSPVGGPVAWMQAYDQGLDPVDPEVAIVAAAGLLAAQGEVGEPI